MPAVTAEAQRRAKRQREYHRGALALGAAPLQGCPAAVGRGDGAVGFGAIFAEQEREGGVQDTVFSMNVTLTRRPRVISND